MSISIPPARAAALPSALRNSIYSALLSSGGIRSIEATLTQLLLTTGFQASLRAYITELFRTGQATTAGEAYGLAMGRVRECMAGVSGGEEGGDDGEGGGEGKGVLKVPDVVVREGSRVVRRELERVVVIEAD